MDTLEQCFAGKPCETVDWDRKIIAIKTAEKLKEHGLNNTYDPKNPIPTNVDLADDFFNAAIELALETGMLCLDTERIIKVDENELKEWIKSPPIEPVYGKYSDQVRISPRKPEDKNPAITHLGGIGNPTSEDLWVQLHQSVAQYRTVDVLTLGTLYTVYGTTVRADTPYELMMGLQEAKLTKESTRRAGRANMPTSMITSSVTDLGHFGGYGVPGGADITDLAVTGTVSELKTNFHYLNKAIHARMIGGKPYVLHHPIVGGFGGGPEGAALIRIAASILVPLIYQAEFVTSQCTDARYGINTSRTSIWADSLGALALSRNYNKVFQGQISPIAGPCTKMLLYETACHSINEAVSGTSIIVGVRSGMGRYPDHWTCLEDKLSAEIIKSSGGMKLDQANEIVKNILPKYEGEFKNPPKGKIATDCYDFKSFKPSKEWLEMYDQVRKELTDLGMALIF